MDREDQPSTSKKAKANKQSKTMYPVTFEEFKKYANVEEYVLKEMERAGSEICRINYKIRHKYYPVVYKQFYASQVTRAKMIRNGLTLKPIPKFLKENLMRMPNEEAKTSTSTEKYCEKLHKHEPCTMNKISSDVNNVNSKLEKDNSPISHLKPLSTKGKNAINLTPKIDKIEGKQLTVESRKITNFFTPLSRARQVPEQNKDVWKRKSDISLESSEIEPQVKRAKDSDSTKIKSVPKSKTNDNRPAHLRKAKPKRHKASNIIENSDSGSDIQIMVDVFGALNSGSIDHVKENVDNSKTSANQVVKDKIEPKEHTIKRRSKEIEAKRRSNVSLNDEISDDSDIRSNIIVVDLSESPLSPIKPPLPKRNRSADLKKSTPSPRINDRRKSQERNRESNSDTEMRLLSISGVGPAKVAYHTKNEINVWLEKGLKALAEESIDEQHTSEYLTEEYKLVDRLKAISSYPEEVKKYIKYLLNLKIQKNEDKLKSGVPQQSSKFKVVTAFLQMTFDEYQVLVNAEKLLSQGNDASGTVKTDLKKQYDAIMRRERPWPRGTYIKLSKLRKYLISKGLQEPIQLKHIPPRILSFEEVLENTNLKACTSLGRKKPPDSYKSLLDLCKKEYLKCCAEGVWIEGIKFKDIQSATEQRSDTGNDTLMELMPPLRVLSSDLRSSLLNPGNSELHIKANNNKKGLDEITINSSSEMDEKNKKSPNRNPEFQDQKATKQHFNQEDALEKCLDKIFNESDEQNEKKNTNDDTQLSDCVPTDYNELKLTLSGDIDKQAKSSSLETSEDIIIHDSPDSAGQLLNGIMHPIHSAPLELHIRQTETKKEILLKLSEITGQLPPSPNLFQSSGESDPKSTQLQKIEVRAPETVYVSCKYSTTFNTEENNLTALSFDQTRDNTDPFADSGNNQEDTIVNGTKMTAALIPDPNIVIKKEQLSMPNNDSEGYSGLDDSVQIIDIPPSEPIEIDDEETTPDLLELLLSRPTKYSTPAVVNLTHIPSASYLEHFPQGQQLPSNLALTQSQSNVSTSNENVTKTAVTGETTDSDARPDGIEVESPYQAFNCNLNKMNTPRRTPTKSSNENLVFTDNMVSVEDTSLEPRNVPQEKTPFSALSNQESYVSIAPQNIPSETELTQSSSFSKSSYQPIIIKDRDNGLKKGELSTAVSQEIKGTDQQLSEKVQEDVDEFVELMCTQESTVSVYYVYVTKEGNISDVISSSHELSKNERQDNESSIVAIENVIPSKADTMEVSKELESSVRLKNDKRTEKSSFMVAFQGGFCKDNCQGAKLLEHTIDKENLESSTNIEDGCVLVNTVDAVISKDASSDIEMLECSSEEEKLSNNIPDADSSPTISKNNISVVELLKNTKEEDDLETSTNIKSTGAATEIMAGDIPKNVSSDVEVMECTNEEVDLEPSNNIYSVNGSTNMMDAKMPKDVSLDVELLEDLESSTNIQNANASMKVIDAENSKDFSLIRNIKGCKGPSMKTDVVQDVGLSEYSSTIGGLLKDTQYAKTTEVSPDTDLHDHNIASEKTATELIKNTDVSTLTIQNNIPSQQRNFAIENSNREQTSLSVVKSGSGGIELVDASEDLVTTERIHDLKASEDLFRDVVLERGLIINIEGTSNTTQETNIYVDMLQTVELLGGEPGNIESSINVPPTSFTEEETEYDNNVVACTLMNKSKSAKNKRELVENIDSPYNGPVGESGIVDKSDRRINSPIERNQHIPKIFATDSTTNVEHLNKNQRSESSIVSSELGRIDFLTRIPVVLDTTHQIHACEGTERLANDHEVPMKILDIGSNDRQPLIFHKQKVYNIPALLPIASVLNDFNNKVIESSAITDGAAGENEDEDLIEVPFLIPRRFIKSLPFNLLSTEQMQHTNSESTIYTIKANLEFNLEEHCIPNNTCSEDVQAGAADQEEQLSPTINRCQFDERMIRDWLGNEAISTAITNPEATSNNVKSTNYGSCDENVRQIAHHRMCLRSKRLSQNIDAEVPSKELKLNTDGHSSNHRQRAKTPSIQSKQKPAPKFKKKTTPKKSSKKHSEFVAQKTHAFRTLPFAAGKKATPSDTDSKQPALTTVEDIDFLIEDASQVAVSSTASQILGTDCTYFEGSQLLQNIDSNYCAPQEQILLTEKQQDPLTDPQVNAYKRMTMFEGFMARKVWQVNLQWKTKQKVDIEVRFNADKRNLSVCDESAKLLFNFSSATWSDVLRVLREIDHFEYKRVAPTNSRTVTPLHNVLRHLFGSVAQVANIKLIIDSFNPYVTCEKVKPVYKKPLQCLTNTIQPSILSRMKTLKENLRNNNT